MKKIVLILLSLLIAMLALAGCGSDAKPAGGEKTVLKVGATAVPHAEILQAVKPVLEKEGIDLQIIEFSDYVQPNLALNDKELDANYFQHMPYLDNFVAEHQVDLVSAAGIHIEPMGIYSKKVSDLKDLAEGASIALPNDPTNGGRSLLLLERAGLIKLKDGVGVKATVQDVVENPKHLQFKEVEAAQVPRALEDVDAAVINTNYAMQADLVPAKDALIIEDSSSPYVNIIAVRKGDENRPEIQKLIKALKSDEVKAFINDKYKGAVVAAF